jgi:hypothetical protein
VAELFVEFEHLLFEPVDEGLFGFELLSDLGGSEGEHVLGFLQSADLVLLLEDYVVPLLNHVVLGLHLVLEQVDSLLCLGQSLLVLFQLLLDVCELISHFLVVRELIVELDLCAILLILELQDFHLQHFNSLILHVLHLKQRHIRLLLKRDHLILHFLLILHIAFLRLLQPLKLLRHFRCILLPHLRNILMVPFLQRVYHLLVVHLLLDVLLLHLQTFLLLQA